MEFEKDEEKVKDWEGNENKKCLPHGTCLFREKMKLDKVKEFNKMENIHFYVLPYRLEFFSYVVKIETGPSNEKVMFLFEENNKKLCLIAKTVSNVIGSKYLIYKPGADQHEGVLRGNMMKTEFTVYNNGFNPRKGRNPKRKQLGFIKFQKKGFFSNQPQSTKIIIPRPGEAEQMGEIGKIYRVDGIEQKCEERKELEEIEQRNMREIMIIKSKNPTFNKNKKIYELDFKGYVNEASFFNCILNVQSGQQCLIMGKRSKNTFSMYVGTPLCLLQAFGFLIANIENKE